MNAESLDEKIRKITVGIRIYAEMFLKNTKEISEAGHVKAFSWMGRFDPTADSTREMTQAATKTSREGLEKLLSPIGEPVPRTNEEMQLLVEKLDTPSFQDRVRESLSKVSGKE